MKRVECLEEFVTISPTTIEWVLPSWGSYLNDLEHSLQFDPETWERYQKNPVPFMTDMLGDFAQQIPDNIPDSQYPRFIEIVVRNYHKNMTTKWFPRIAEEGEIE